jgi:hypothetical protein
MNKKKIIIIIITILVLLLVALLVYNIFFKPKPEVISDDFFESPEEILTESPELNKESRLLRLSTKPVVSFNVLGENITVVFTDGSIGKISLGDTPEESITNIGSKVVGSKISSQGDMIALQVNNGDMYGRWIIFDKNTGGLESLSPNVRSVVFSPQGKTLLIRQDDSGYSLIIRDEGEESTISNINIPDLVATWVDEETIGISTKPSGMAPNILYFLNTKTNLLTSILGNKFGLTFNISPKKDWILFSSTNNDGRGSMFKVKSLEEESEKMVSISTLPEKCVFSQDIRYVFCAIFKNSPSRFIMPDDYYKGVFSSSASTILKVNLGNSQTEEIEKIPLDLIDPQISNNEDILFFIDKNSKQLYRLKI